MVEQLSGGEVLRMAAFEDRPSDVGREIDQPQDPREIGARQPLPSRKIGEMFVAALGQLVAEEVCSDDQLDQLRIGSRRPTRRNRPIDQHSDAETHAPERCRD